VIEERPELNVLSRPVLVVTTMSVFLILSGKQPEVSRIGLDAHVRVDRKDHRKLGSTLRLTTADGVVRTFVYEPRAHIEPTADLITERFFGRIVTDTTDLSASPEGEDHQEISAVPVARDPGSAQFRSGCCGGIFMGSLGTHPLASTSSKTWTMLYVSSS